MYAIVEASGRQYQLEAGRFVDIDLVGIEPGEAFVFDRVLMIVDGKDSHIGGPLVDGAKVTGKVLEHSRDKKIIVYHQRPKKGTRKKQGHRQGYTRVMIDKIELKDKVLAEAKTTARAEKAPKQPAKKAEVKEEKTKAAPKKAAADTKKAKPAETKTSAAKGKAKSSDK